MSRPIIRGNRANPVADLIDNGDNETRIDQRLRLSIKWRSTRQRTMFPGEAYAQFDIGFFMGVVPLFNDAVYGPAIEIAGSASDPGYLLGG